MIKNAVIAAEYRQPGVDIRTKEEMLNFAVSFLRPIDPILKEVLCEAAGANKIMMNVERGRKMIHDLPFYMIEPEELGSESDDEQGNKDSGSGDLASVINQQIKEAQNANQDDEDSPMMKALKVLQEDHRMEDKRKIVEAELNINDYKVEPMTTQCMTDFAVLEAPDIDEITCRVPAGTPLGEAPLELPINYYDNDDGFWDNYIEHKE